MITLAWATRTDVGLRRTTNEDALVAAPPVFAVADGMGGHAAGDVASAIAVEALGRLADNRGVTRREVLEAIRGADAEIWDRATGDSTGMGTTITGLVTATSDTGTDTIVAFNVGDSRSYLLRDAHLTQVSHDHSVVQELVDDGTITAEQARTHPERNVITRSLGAGVGLDIDWWVIDPLAGDRFLLCSDGLFKEADDSFLAEVLTDSDDLEDAATRLLDAALDAGGTDNITLVIVDIVAVTPTADPDETSDDTNPVATLDDDDTNPNLIIPAHAIAVAGSTPEPPKPAPVPAHGLAVSLESGGPPPPADTTADAPPSDTAESVDPAPIGSSDDATTDAPRATPAIIDAQQVPTS